MNGAAEGAAGSPEPKRRILIVEDNPVNMLILRTILRRNGHEPLVATDGVDGLSMAQQHRPALILMDIQMPRMDGLAAARAIWARPDMKDVPIIALTADITDQAREACLSAGFERVMVKPLDLKELSMVVDGFITKAS